MIVMLDCYLVGLATILKLSTKLLTTRKYDRVLRKDIHPRNQE
jgi:hypothetical protein